MKLLGALLLIGTGSTIGFCKAYELKQRIRGIIMLQNAFRLLETEIFYSRTPVPQAIALLEPKLSGTSRQFFYQVRNAVESEHQPLYVAWDSALQCMAQNSFWRSEELEAVRNFGYSLGAGDAMEQQKNFQLLQQRLQQALCHAEQMRAEKARIWQYMGICASAAAVLMLY